MFSSICISVDQDTSKQSLRTLDLEYNPIGVEGAPYLAEILGNNIVKHLLFSSNIRLSLCLYTDTYQALSSTD